MGCHLACIGRFIEGLGRKSHRLLLPPLDCCMAPKKDPILNDGATIFRLARDVDLRERMGQLARTLFEKRLSCNKIYSSAGLATLITWIEPAPKLQFDPLVLLSRTLHGFYCVLVTLISSGSPF